MARSRFIVDADGNRYSRKTGMLVRTRRSAGYHARKAGWYKRLAKDARALGSSISAKLYGVLGMEHGRKAKRAASHKRSR